MKVREIDGAAARSIATCPMCGATFSPIDPRQVCCSKPCGARRALARRQRELAALMADGREWTKREIARELYGFDDPAEVHAATMLVHRMRRAGYRVVTVRGTPPRYRLVKEEAA